MVILFLNTIKMYSIQSTLSFWKKMKKSLTERHALLDVSIGQNHSTGILSIQTKKKF